jgi:hypothetical protein
MCRLPSPVEAEDRPSGSAFVLVDDAAEDIMAPGDRTDARSPAKAVDSTFRGRLVATKQSSLTRPTEDERESR